VGGAQRAAVRQLLIRCRFEGGIGTLDISPLDVVFKDG